MNSRDVPAALELSSDAGWNQTARDWHTLLALAPETCLAIECEEALAATATLLCYGTKLAWIGMVLTQPGYRRRGFATSLVKEALRIADERKIETVKLDATEMGQPLYATFGFEPEQPVQRWWRNRRGSEAITEPRASASGLDAFEADRSSLLEALALNCTSVSEEDAFLFTRPGRLARYLGPCIASRQESARRLIDRALSLDSAWCWDLLPENRASLELARDFGFTP
ncbi:MAG: GNAT family N-acetyltransferase, partial [Acidobacteriota bacterium]|nr:GNAT family N-acetyltransferase [Acidobacteriota bacterium]